jgi:hypothetical protein
MLVTSELVVLLFSYTSSLTQPIFLSVVGRLKHFASSTEVTPNSTWQSTQKLAVLPFSAFQKLLSSLPFSGYAKFANRGAHTCIYQESTQQPYMLQPYSRQEMTQQTVLYAHLMVEVCASSRNVIL